MLITLNDLRSPTNERAEKRVPTIEAIAVITTGNLAHLMASPRNPEAWVPFFLVVSAFIVVFFWALSCAKLDGQGLLESIPREKTLNDALVLFKEERILPFSSGKTKHNARMANKSSHYSLQDFLHREFREVINENSD